MWWELGERLVCVFGVKEDVEGGGAGGRVPLQGVFWNGVSRV